MVFCEDSTYLEIPPPVKPCFIAAFKRGWEAAVYAQRTGISFEDAVREFEEEVYAESKDDYCRACW